MHRKVHLNAWLGFGLVLVMGCGLVLPPARLDKVMASNGGSFYFYGDDDLEISLRIGPGKVFDWRFKNRGRQKLTLAMESLALRRAGDSQVYALWGEPRDNLAQVGPLTLAPGGFANYTFPVRSKSPFWPFRPESAESYRLSFTVRWGYRDYRYDVGFEPLLSVPDREAQATKKGVPR